MSLGRPVLAPWPGRVLGVDAGGSSTRLAVVEEGRVVDEWQDRPLNVLLSPELTGPLATMIRRAGVDRAGIGLPGLRSVAQARRLAGTLAKETGALVRATTDVDVALLGAFLGDPGIVVVAGTGSVAAGTDGRRRMRAGGHGFLLGDEGSGYWIGQQALRAALRARDGLGPPTRLAEVVTGAWGCGLDAALARVYRHPVERNLLAGLAPLVAAETDPEAGRILRAAAESLAGLAQALRDRLGALPVAAVGGVFGSAQVRRRFEELVGPSAPLAPPAVGAALLAAPHHVSSHRGSGQCPPDR